jgi:hypothetical protein
MVPNSVVKRRVHDANLTVGGDVDAGGSTSKAFSSLISLASHESSQADTHDVWAAGARRRAYPKLAQLRIARLCR